LWKFTQLLSLFPEFVGPWIVYFNGRDVGRLTDSTETRTHVPHTKANERLAKKLEELNGDEDKANQARLDPDFWVREAKRFRNTIEIRALSSFSLFY
jgi:hypothetical protein